MLKSIIFISVFATGVTLPSVADIQPVEGATLNISQISLNWDETGFDVKPIDEADFAFTINLTSDHAVSLKF